MSRFARPAAGWVAVTVVLAGRASAGVPVEPVVAPMFRAFVDAREVFNEDSHAPDDYLAPLAAVIRKADPHGRLLTTNDGRPGAPWGDLTPWHEYMGMPAREADACLASRLARFKPRGKLAQDTEFRNQGAVSNVDPRKGRAAVRAAHMHESSPVFRGMSQRQFPAGQERKGNANACIGPETRRAFRVFHALTRNLPETTRPVTVGYADQVPLRALALAGERRAVTSVHHVVDHATAFTLADPLLVQTDPGHWRVRWMCPEPGGQRASETVESDRQYLSLRVPPVTVDAVARLERVD